MSGWLPARVAVEDGCAVYAINTAVLRAQDYTVRARIERQGQEAAPLFFPLTVAKKHDAERLPVWRWGAGSDLGWWVERGYTGGFISARRDPVGDPASSSVKTVLRLYEDATRLDYELGVYTHPLLCARLAEDESNLCLKPDGSRYGAPKARVHPLVPAVIEHGKAVASSWLELLDEYPSLRHVMFCSEYQTPYSVNPEVVELAKEEIGLDIRQFLTEKGGLKSGGTVTGGIIDDDHPHYRFLQWWWQRGHGTAVFNEALAPVVKARRPDVLTWHEPYRLAPVRGSHRGLDCIATWTYGYPDIKRLCYTTYLQAAARPARQLVQQDITLYVYGKFAVQLDESTADLSQDHPGKDPFFTAGPDYAKEAMVAGPVAAARHPLLLLGGGALAGETPLSTRTSVRLKLTMPSGRPATPS